MSGIVVGVDLCEQFAVMVYGGRLPDGTLVVAQRCREWPCPGRKELTTGPPEHRVTGLVECTCTCHLPDAAGHRLPRLADRTAVHPTDVLADG